MKQQEQGFRSPNSQAIPHIDGRETIYCVHQPVILQMAIRGRPGMEPRYPVVHTISFCFYNFFFFVLLSELFISFYVLLQFILQNTTINKSLQNGWYFLMGTMIKSRIAFLIKKVASHRSYVWATTFIRAKIKQPQTFKLSFISLSLNYFICTTGIIVEAIS